MGRRVQEERGQEVHGGRDDGGAACGGADSRGVGGCPAAYEPQRRTARSVRPSGVANGAVAAAACNDNRRKRRTTCCGVGGHKDSNCSISLGSRRIRCIPHSHAISDD